MRVPFSDTDFPDAPYPGAWPEHSFVHIGRKCRPVHADRASASGWRLAPDDTDLDTWLLDQDAPPLAERVPVLTYGSNRCPSKVSWLRERWGLSGPVVVLHARCTGLSAVWAAGFRVVDDQRPATLTAAPGVVEQHAVWLATVDQVRVLDRCEGRGERYRLARLRSGRVVLADGAVLDDVLAYTAAAPARRPLLVDGRPVRCADLAQDAAAALTGVAGATDGLDASTVDGDPDPACWPPRLFVYGTLQPGDVAWGLVEHALAGPPRAARLPGTLYDTGLGYPASRPGAGPGVPGFVLPLRAPERVLPALDHYEGSDYRRVRATLPDGQVCWTYVWAGSVRGMPVLPRGWAAR